MDNYKQNIIEYHFNKIHPKLEIYRAKIINKLFNRFYKICNTHKNINKSKTDDFMTRFCWLNLSNYDPVLPYKINSNYNFTQLRKDLINYKLPAQLIITQLNIHNFFNYYIEKFKKIYNKINYDKPIKVILIDNKLIYKNKYEISTNSKVIANLNKFYNDQYINKYAIFFCILYRYNILDANNQQLSLNLDFKEDLRKYFNINIELFGSAINRYYDKYCSLYYDLEKYFGSLGNFFNMELIKGLYMCNPPFDELLMENMANKLILSLDNTQEALGFIITIPVWDFETQKKISDKCKTKYSDYGQYKAYELLRKSKYYLKSYTFCKNSFPYYNFSQDKYINAVNSYIIIIKNDKLEFNLKKFEKILSKNKLIYI